MQRVARRVVVGAQRLEPRLGGAHLRLDRFQRDGQRRDFRSCTARAPRTASCCLANHSRCCDVFEPRLELAVLRGDLRLLVEARQLVAELEPDVLDAREVLAGVGEPPFGLLAPLLVLRDARGFLEEDAQLLGLAPR